MDMRVRAQGSISPSQAAMTDVMAALARVMDRRPKELGVIHSAVRRALRKRKMPGKVDERPGFAAAILPELLPELLRSEKVKTALDALVTEYSALACVPAGQSDTGSQVPPGAHAIAAGAVVGAIGVGLVAGAVIVGVVIIYLAVSDDGEEDDSG
jgi:hypothetical protein